MLYTSVVNSLPWVRSTLQKLYFSLFSSSKWRICSAFFTGPNRWQLEGARSGLWAGWGRTVHPVFVIAWSVHKLVWGWALSWRRRTSFVFQLGWTQWIHCHSLFKVSLSCSELIVIPFLSTVTAICRLAASGLVSFLCCTTLKMPDSTSYFTHINDMLSIHTVQAPRNFYGTNLLGSKEFSHHCLLHTCICNMYCWTACALCSCDWL
jgi:hypothetical protein